MDNIIYSDIDLNFNKHPVKDDLVISTNEIAVKRAVKFILLTSFYERPFHPEIGSNIRKMFFNVSTSISDEILAKEIYDVLKNFEPRVSLKKRDIIIESYPDNNAIKITVNFIIKVLGTPASIDVLLQRVR